MKTQAYVKGVVLGFVLIVLMISPVLSPSVMQWQYAKAVAAASSMSKIQLILKKMRGSMTSMKDFDELEAAGMAKKDVDRMRRAMTQKIQQLTDEAIESIRAL
ncbi:MAG: hypothetical protein Q9M20_06755 [Mariprofundaceae bacterium]|nr:hypothetical protein [Mariprofundaceae bacterium]